ncbi:MAG: hypothetical protein PHV55_04505 [Candidatus Omnitrophica bacterium]|nr:hypothetical protein [Candidatus Omnitrophota bacterium]
MRIARTILAFFLLVHTAGFLSFCQEPASQLIFNAQADRAAYRQGEPIGITLRITNQGTQEAKIFHPDILGKSWEGCDWDLQCTVRKPNGATIVLAPDIRLQASYSVEPRYFKVIAPGAALEIPLKFKGNKVFDPIRKAYSSNEEGDDWVGLIEIGAHAANISDEDARSRFHIKGDYGFMSGDKNCIIVKQLLADVFNAPGQYRLDFEYTNNCNFASSTDRQGRIDQWDKVVDAWTGKLTASVTFEIEK